MLEFRNDLRRYLDGEVIHARPAGMGTRLRKYAKRNPLIVATAGMAFFFVIAWLGYGLLFAYPAILHERDQARNERNKTVAAEELKQEQLKRIRRLSDLKMLDELKSRETRLWPALPEMASAMKTWLRDAGALISRLDLHRATLDSLLAETGRDPAEAGGGFTPDPGRSMGDRPGQWYFEQLNMLVAGIASFEADENHIIQNVRERLARAESIERESIINYSAAWQQAIASIADRNESPCYEGLLIDPVIGLVPLGRDAGSGLWEFAHVQTGEMARRGMDGALQITGATGCVLVLIPGGTFTMGAGKLPPGSTVQTYVNEVPAHEVTVQPFFLSKYEMTQGQWLYSTGSNPSTLHPGVDEVGEYTLRHPVENVSWDECNATLFHLDLRFPSEAEWEYGARGGLNTIWAMGDQRESLEGAANLCDQVYYRNSDPLPRLYDDWLNDGYLYHAPVGLFKPNLFGLHDVHGNVWEWCQDFYHLDYVGAPADGSAWESPGMLERVYRGGGFDFPSQYCKLTFRYKKVSHYKYLNMGIRPARSLGK
ncbi:MAG: formylglycine-generating enzyme family protein [Planctomycetota bacterium]